jgi:hypothetical protein
MCCGDDKGAGPGVDVEFFNELDKVFDKYPDMSRKYSIDALPFEAEKLGVNLDTYLAVTRLEGDRIIIEFQPRDQLVDKRVRCCAWSHSVCKRWCWIDM